MTLKTEKAQSIEKAPQGALVNMAARVSKRPQGRTMIRLTSVLAFAGTVLFSGCASIVSGHNQSVSLTAASDGKDVAGAKCSLVNDKGSWYATTPGSVTVRRSYDDLTINCASEGLAAGIASVKSTTKGMAFGNLLFGGIIGVGVDISTGAAYDYPSLIPVTMGRTMRLEMDAKGMLIAKDMNDANAIAKAQTAGSSVVAAPAPTSIAPPAPSSPVAPPAVPVSSTASAPAASPPVAAATSSNLPAASLTTVAPQVKAVPVALAAKDNGQDGYQAERFAKDQTCKAARASLVAKGAGFETHAVACEGSDVLMVRCEFGNCRLLR